jgi:hypothetical protein
MEYETMKTYRTLLRPSGEGPDQDIAVNVDGRDLPDARSVYVNNIYIDRVLNSLRTLFGRTDEEVSAVRIELEAGREVRIEIDCLPSQLGKAQFVPR